ncbi:MAG: hypothetical protein Q4B01_08715, partial [Eubacteriales bacterium]|nr:hypothetical protein [Eubacteriales bacterium]
MSEFEVKSDLLRQAAERESGISKGMGHFGDEIRSVASELALNDASGSNMKRKLRELAEKSDDSAEKVWKMSEALEQIGQQYQYTEEKLVGSMPATSIKVESGRSAGGSGTVTSIPGAETEISAVEPGAAAVIAAAIGVVGASLGAMVGGISEMSREEILHAYEQWLQKQAAGGNSGENASEEETEELEESFEATAVAVAYQSGNKEMAEAAEAAAAITAGGAEFIAATAVIASEKGVTEAEWNSYINDLGRQTDIARAVDAAGSTTSGTDVVNELNQGKVWNEYARTESSGQTYTQTMSGKGSTGGSGKSGGNGGSAAAGTKSGGNHGAASGKTSAASASGVGKSSAAKNVAGNSSSGAKSGAGAAKSG